MGKHAIITGGSSGIGLAVAKLIAAEGSNVSIIARNLEKLNSAQQELAKVAINPTQKILGLAADVTDNEQLTARINQAIAILGKPDLLVTSAGIAIPDHFDNLSLEIFEQTMQVNYFGSLFAIKAVLPAMKDAGTGKIVLISSGAGLVGLYGYTAYSSSKFALRGLAESLRAELKPQGIQVAIVYPPDTNTPQLAAENKTKPTATKAITATAKTWSAEEVAQEIIKGINRQKFAIAPGLELTLLNRLHSLILPILNRYFDQIIAKNS